MHNTSDQDQLSPLKRAYLALEKMQAKLEAIERERTEPIAIIGLGCRFPGADNSEAFWRLLRDGVDAISEVPADRWDTNEFFDADPDTPGKMTTRWGGFLHNVHHFDAHFFGISPREAERMDPQQRLLLEVTWEALEDASLSPTKLVGSRTGVFIGISNSDYSLISSGDLSSVDAYFGTGNALCIAANRLSYLFDFQGPSISVDTACSSSIVSTHLACQSLRTRESDLAIAGGVNLILDPLLTITFSHARMMAADGRCKTFDASADGYVRGEGCGVVILKRLSDALRDGDNILALIRGSAVNQDGRSNGLTAPNGIAQQRVIQQALKNAGVSAEQIDYIETHGTGTILGDPIEVQAIGAIMNGRAKTQPCVIGSAKTNIGHLEAAAGIASLIKVVLALQHNLIPPHLHFKEINPHIPIDELPLEIPTKPKPWSENGKPRFAGISSFGFGGTNAHLIVEEAPAPSKVANEYERPSHLLTLSAKDETALRQLASRFVEYVSEHPTISLGDICFTAASGRNHFAYRMAAPAGSTGEMAEKLSSFVKGEDAAGIVIGKTQGTKRSKIAFLFTGQGSQYPGMSRELYDTQPTFRREMDRCAEILKSHLERPLLSVVFPQDFETALLDETQYTQPALFSIEYALAKLWQSWGVQPAYLLGHSIGEYVAACIAGVFSLEDALKLVAARGRLMQSLPQDGEMAVVFAEPEKIQERLAHYADTVSAAAHNGPSNTVISGKREDVEALLKRFAENGIESRLLKVSHAFHSPLMEPILAEFARVANEVSFHAPRIPVISNLDGKVLPSDEIPGAEYWTRHIRSCVQFAEGIKTLAELDCQVFLEIGPNPHALNMARRCLPKSAALWLPSLKEKQSDWQLMLTSLAELYVHGFEINWAGFEQDYHRRKVQLPTYPFQRERYWPDFLAKRNGKYSISGQAEMKREPQQDLSMIDLQPAAQVPEETYSRETLLSAAPESRLSLLTSILQKQLAKVLRLAPDRVDIQQPITNLGLDSIMAIELKNKLETSFQVDIPIAELIEGISVENLAARVLSQMGEAGASSAALSTAAGPEEGDYPLSLGQKAMWIQHQMAPASIFNPVYAVRIRSKIDAERFRRVFQLIVDRHPALRTTFVRENGEPIQRVHKAMEAAFTVVDAGGWNQEELQKRISEQAHQTFDLENGPLFRVHLFSTSENESVLLLAAHHIVVDMWSLAVIVREVGLLYTSEGSAEVLPPIKARYSDFVRWQSDLLSSPKGEKLWRYWQKQLAGDLPILSLPTDHPRPAIQTFRGQSKSMQFDAKLTQQLKEISQRHNVTLYMTLLAAFKALLYRYTGQEDIVIGSPTTGRSQPEFLESVGYFVNPVPLRSRIHGELAFSAFLKSIQQTVVEAIEHQDYPLYGLVEKLHPARDLSRTPVFQVMFVYQRAHLLNEEGLSSFSLGAEGSQMNLAGIQLESFPIAEQVAPFDMTFMMAESAGGLGATITFNTDLFNASSIDRFLQHFAVLLESITENPQELVSRLAIFPKPELDQLLCQWNTTKTELPIRQCIHELFEDQVRRNPDARALISEGRELTYGALNERANQLARCLRKVGVASEVLVGVCADRSIEMLIGLLAILKAGGAYLPLDPEYPVERLSYMLKDSRALVLLTQKKLAADLPPFAGTIIYLDDSADFARENSDNLPPMASPDNLAYLIYTSGSTGKPKGVMVAHRGLCNLVRSQIQAFAVHEDSLVLQYASLSFDASISEIFMALVSGACLYLAKPEILHSAPALLNLFNEAGITTVTLPPSLLRVLPAEEVTNVKTIISAGEACPKDLAARWSTNRRFLNAYGPTEATIGVTSYLLENLPAECTSLPIGRPIANTQLYILDQHLNPVPIGATGELYIGGIGLARGYINGSDLTAERFIPDPFSEVPGSRLYRTGDLAHYLADGNIEFLGRIDHQVKIRGFRIEVGEIESVLSQHPALRDVFVLARASDHGSRDYRLIAYIVADKNRAPSANDLRIYLRTKLPEYMIPADFISLEALPLTHNGKIDRKKLPAPKAKRADAADASAAPKNEIERAIAGIWQEVLNLEKVGVHDNFFDLGGHSLNLMQVQLKVKQVLKKEISAIDMFSYPTVSAFAKFLEQDQGGKISRQQRVERANKQQAAINMQRQRMMQRRPMK